jgi:type VI secretion system protein ImpK
MPDIDDPFKPSDATVLRPRPGAGKRGSGDVAPPPRASAPPSSYVDPISDAARESLGAGLNPLAQAASPLLLLAGQLRGTLAMPELAGLRRHALDEIRRFEERARSLGVHNDIVLPARYLLCASLDEAVLSTPWGSQSEWAQQPLLVALHREAWGGEKFFELLDRISQDPARHVDLLELQYLCLSLGFAGKFQVQARGDSRLAEIKHTLFRAIRDQRGTVPPELSLRWKGLQDRRSRLVRYVPWWVVGAMVLALLAMTFAVYYARLGRAAAPLHTELANVGLEGFHAPVTAPPAGEPTLKMLLAPENARGALSVEEEGGRTVITPLAPDLFTSGSATPNPAHAELLQRVAEAINKVPGRVLVEGHTDDQPLASLRYRNNFELSRERAVSVARILQRGAANPARIEWSGVGSSKPRYRPESDPENRARNRRVEIIHVR